MARLMLFLLTVFLLSGCKSHEPKSARCAHSRNNMVDVDVSRHSVNVQVRPEKSDDDVDVHVAWP